MKICTYCDESKDEENFHKRKASKDGLSPWCKSCYSIIIKERYSKNPTFYKNKVKIWAGKNKIKIRNSNLKRRYHNFSLEEYNNMFILQEGNCAICGIHQSNLEKGLCVDHNHSTGKVRGLLCVSCNLGMGFLKEDLFLIDKLKQYIIKYN